jgi:hypothetical protein
MSPVQPIKDPARLDERRRAVGLPSHAEDFRRHRASAGRLGEPRPADLAARRRAMEAWARRVGWRPPAAP